MNPSSLAPSSATPYKILRLYLKGASVEVPNMAGLPQQALSPQVGVDMQTEATPAWPGALECVLRISLHARLEGNNVFVIEVSEAGVFELDLSDIEQAHRFVRQVAPSVLFPFARKDLASLTVAAGFQPVLLDHVDFDAMLTQVIKAQRLTRAPEAMRLDVITTKPTAATPLPVTTPAPAPAAAQEAAADDVTVDAATAQQDQVWRATMPMTFADEAQQPLPGVQANRSTSKRPARLAVAVLGIATVAATLAWWLDSGTRTPVPPVAVALQPKTVATPPAPPVPPPVVVPADVQAAIDISRARLAEQPANWFTLNMGAVPLSTPLSALNNLPADRALFVVPGKANTLRVLYGVFPSQAAAAQVQQQLQQSELTPNQAAATVVMIGSLN